MDGVGHNGGRCALVTDAGRVVGLKTVQVRQRCLDAAGTDGFVSFNIGLSGSLNVRLAGIARSTNLSCLHCLHCLYLLALVHHCHQTPERCRGAYVVIYSYCAHLYVATNFDYWPKSPKMCTFADVCHLFSEHKESGVIFFSIF